MAREIAFYLDENGCQSCRIRPRPTTESLLQYRSKQVGVPCAKASCILLRQNDRIESNSTIYIPYVPADWRDFPPCEVSLVRTAEHVPTPGRCLSGPWRQKILLIFFKKIRFFEQ